MCGAGSQEQRGDREERLWRGLRDQQVLQEQMAAPAGQPTTQLRGL